MSVDNLVLVIVVIVIALFFDFTNGFHDTANAMATPIATGALKPRTAVALAATLNLVGAFMSTAVAHSVANNIIKDPSHGGITISPVIIFAGLTGAVIWNMVTWLLGLPSSSSHALFGGLIGAAIVGAGFGAVNVTGVLDKVLIPAVLSPFVAGFVAFASTRLAYFVTRRSDGFPDGRGVFRRGQILSSSLVALSHGTNDAQKTMGVITLVLVTAGIQTGGTDPQWWVIVACALAIALGTYTGGWRIIRTLGQGLTKVKPAQGFAAETSTAATILASSHFGFALSTTQVASGSVIGSGLGRRGSLVRWGTVGKIVVGWLLTLPASAIVGAIVMAIAHIGVIGVIIDGLLAVAAVTWIFVRSKRNEVHADNALGTEVADSGHAIDIKGKRRRAKRQAKAGTAPKDSTASKDSAATKGSAASKAKDKEASK